MEVIDWLAGYMKSVEDQRIVPNVVPGEIYRSLPDVAPEKPEPFDHLLKDLDDLVMPGIVHWQSPGWFAFFPSNNSGPSMLGELATAGLAQQGMN